MEKEENIMQKELKIVLPFYKIAYSISFIIILSIIRGVTFTYEIGIAMEAPIAILVTVFCADTYVQEIMSNRFEVHRLYPVRKRFFSILERLMIQGLFLLLLAVIGYGCFLLFQKPATHPVTGSEAKQFMIYFASIIITIFFWGFLSNMLSMVFRNIWAGIGGCLLIWLAVNSTWGDKVLGAWNLFSYTFRDVENNGDITWVYGKLMCMCVGAVLIALLPKIIKKRG